MSETLKAGIIGASGIGKNHAKWFDKHGCRVTAFLGSHPLSVEYAQDMLEEKFGIRARGFWNMEEFLAQPLDMVCVASPPPLHFHQVRACLARRIPVLCEKPLVYDPDIPPLKIRSQCDELVTSAERGKVLFGTQMQYAMVARHLWEVAGRKPVQRLEMVMETNKQKEGRTHQEIWVDLAPHPLSVLQQYIGPHAWLEDIQCEVEELETNATFLVKQWRRQPVEVSITTRCAPEAKVPLRRFVINDSNINYFGRNNQHGQFRSYLVKSGQEEELPDFVDLLIGNFVAACKGEENLKVTGAHGAQVVSWMLEVLEQARIIAE